MSRPLILFAPGAGAPSSHPWMQRWKERLAQLGNAEAFDYDYMRDGRKRPDPPAQLIAAHRRALAEARERHPDATRVILAGKSMGGRIGCHVSLEEKVDALICFGYPLCAMGDRTKLRDKVLRDLQTPVLFIQGTRDKLCPLELLENVRREMSAPNFLHIVEGGDHSLQALKRQLAAGPKTQNDVDDEILGAVSQFASANTSAAKPSCR